jgi:hypothetical protein
VTATINAAQSADSALGEANSLSTNHPDRTLCTCSNTAALSLEPRRPLKCRLLQCVHRPAPSHVCDQHPRLARRPLPPQGQGHLGALPGGPPLDAPAEEGKRNQHTL